MCDWELCVAVIKGVMALVVVMALVPRRGVPGRPPPAVHVLLSFKRDDARVGPGMTPGSVQGSKGT